MLLGKVGSVYNCLFWVNVFLHFQLLELVVLAMYFEFLSGFVSLCMNLEGGLVALMVVKVLLLLVIIQFIFTVAADKL